MPYYVQFSAFNRKEENCSTEGIGLFYFINNYAGKYWKKIC